MNNSIHNATGPGDFRAFGRLWLTACCSIALVLLGRCVWLPASSERELLASNSPTLAAESPSASNRHTSPKAGARKHAFRPIESLRVGDRVVAENPEKHTPEGTSVDPQTWRLAKLYAEQQWPDGTLDTIHVETLQPPMWLELFEAEVGSQVPPPLDLLEMGLPEDLLTEVVSVSPCPELAPGSGRVVLTTVDHLNKDVWELTALDSSGRREQLRPTGLHRFYSETRGDWVSAKEVHDNEVIRGRAGPLTIVDAQPLAGTHRVYNLTVEGEHVYYVSKLGLLAHNNCGESGVGPIRSAVDADFVSPQGGYVRYGALDDFGRPTTIQARITPDMIGTGTPANRRIQPPGFITGKRGANRARGHLLGDQLGGPGDEVRNLVTLEQNAANSPVMRSFETSIRQAVEGGQIVDYTVTPLYNFTGRIPRGVTLRARSSGGFMLDVTVLNPPGM